MSKAFIIEIESRTAGIVAKDGHRYCWNASSTDWTAANAERAARALLQERGHLTPFFAAAF
jgi:hypothetical protein